MPVGPRRYNLMIDLGVISTVPYYDEFSGACEWQQGFDGMLNIGDIVVMMGGHYTIPAYMPNGGTTMLLPGGDEYIVSAKGFADGGMAYLLKHEDFGGEKSKEMIISNGEATIQYAESTVDELRGLDETISSDFEDDIHYILEAEYEGINDPELSKAISKKDAITLAGYALMESTQRSERYGGRVIVADDDCISEGRPQTTNHNCWIMDSEGRNIMLLYGDIVIADNKPFRYLGVGTVTSQQWEGEYLEEYREALYNVTEQSGGQVSLKDGKLVTFSQLPNGRYADGSKNGGTESQATAENTLVKVAAYRYKTLWVKNSVSNTIQSTETEPLFAQNAGWEPEICRRAQTIDGVTVTTYHTELLSLPPEGTENADFVASTELEDTEYSGTEYSSITTVN